MMNDRDIENIKTIIEDVMCDYMFDSNDQKTIDGVTGDLAMLIEVDDFYDYTLEAGFVDDELIVDVQIKDVRDGGIMHFIGSTGDTPALSANVVNETERNAAFDRAMELI